MTPSESIVASCICGDTSCTIPFGLCHCGCGGSTTIASQSVTRHGYVRGLPKKFMLGHRFTPRTVIMDPLASLFIDDLPCKLLPLTQGQVTIVDMDEYDRTFPITWVAHWLPDMEKFRAVARVGKETIYLHRFIMGIEKGDCRLVDHRNGNPLDNRRCNLRFGNKSKNGMNRGKTRNNTSGFKGVTWSSQHEKWMAQIVAQGRHYFLGLFDADRPDQAHVAYCRAAEQLHGEFARFQ